MDGYLRTDDGKPNHRNKGIMMTKYIVLVNDIPCHIDFSEKIWNTHPTGFEYLTQALDYFNTTAIKPQKMSEEKYKDFSHRTHVGDDCVEMTKWSIYSVLGSVSIIKADCTKFTDEEKGIIKDFFTINEISADDKEEA